MFDSPILRKTPSELFKGKTTNILHLKPFTTNKYRNSDEKIARGGLVARGDGKSTARIVAKILHVLTLFILAKLDRIFFLDMLLKVQSIMFITNILKVLKKAYMLI